MRHGVVTAQGKERNIQSLMSSAFGKSDFEYAKTQEVREKYMDNVDMEPGFQV